MPWFCFRLHSFAVCGVPPTQPLGQESNLFPSVFTTAAAALTIAAFLQQGLFLHFVHLIAPQFVHSCASIASVMSEDWCGGQTHAISLVDDNAVVAPSALAWIYSVLEDGGVDGVPSDFVTECLRWFETRLLQLRVTSPEYTRELLYIYGRLCKLGGYGKETDSSLIPAFAVGVRSPKLVPCIRDVAVLCGTADVSDVEASYLLYQLTLKSLSLCPVPVNVDSVDSSAFEHLFAVLLQFSDDCLFPTTGDLYLHLVIGAYLPSWRGALFTSVAYPLLSVLYGAAANSVARPYMDTPVSTLLRDRQGNCESDDVILFILVTTLISELVSDAKLSPVMNRGILGALSGPGSAPRPFVLCDFGLPSLEGSDAYGFVGPDYRLCVCNGLGVASAVSAWLSACYSCGKAEVIHEFLSGCGGPTNPLVKYAKSGTVSALNAV